MLLTSKKELNVSLSLLLDLVLLHELLFLPLTSFPHLLPKDSVQNLSLTTTLLCSMRNTLLWIKVLAEKVQEMKGVQVLSFRKHLQRKRQIPRKDHPLQILIRRKSQRTLLVQVIDRREDDDLKPGNSLNQACLFRDMKEQTLVLTMQTKIKDSNRHHQSLQSLIVRLEQELLLQTSLNNKQHHRQRLRTKLDEVRELHLLLNLIHKTKIRTVMKRSLEMKMKTRRRQKLLNKSLEEAEEGRRLFQEMQQRHQIRLKSRPLRRKD